MAYALDFDQSPEAAVHAVGRERLSRARHHLVVRPDGLATGIHEARKDLKRFRALARLVRGELPRGAYRRANGMARDAARELSGVRDATALLETADALDDAFGPTVREPVTGPLRAQLEAQRERIDDAELERGVHAAIERLDLLLERELPSWSVRRKKEEFWVEGFTRTYQRAREALAAARDRRTTEALHEWRKRAKYHRYHLRLLRPVWRRVVQAQRKEVKDLSSLLGDDHDLAVLAQRLEAGDLGGELDRDLLNGLILERRARLQERAFATGRLAFAEKPKRLAKRLARYTRADAKRRRAAARAGQTVEDAARV